ncbi:MAG TPA: rod-binding protein [Campylobacterales bacterium]|nr:rod-binding protein [Campylobacterales bacterium]
MNIDNSVVLSSLDGKNFKVNTQNDIKLKESTDAFESFLIKKILDISLKRENSIFGKDVGDKIYNSMYNDTMSRSLSGGFGFSQLLFNFLKEQQNS